MINGKDICSSLVKLTPHQPKGARAKFRRSGESEKQPLKQQKTVLSKYMTAQGSR